MTLSPLPCGGNLSTVRAGEREDNTLLPARGDRDVPAASSKFNPAHVSGPQPGVREVVAVRICVGRGRAHRCTYRVLETPQLARTGFGLAGSLLPYWRGFRLFQFVPALKASGSLLRLSIRIALQACKQTARCISEAFHFNLSAGRSGLAAYCDGHTVERKEMTCPTQGGSRMTRNGAKLT